MKLLFEEIPFNDDYLNVEMEGDPIWENASFDYAGTHCTHGQSGTHYSSSYSTIEDVSWDREMYSEDQNKAIELYVKEEWDYIENAFCSQLERDEYER